ncbi:MAG: hypothetical protein E6Q97_00240 [Desulfurellales bacterium]|nr:MAG: hypothetical protein E6Q97_00240 [Desulfurellales bacterium]
MTLQDALPIVGVIAGALGSYYGAHTALKVEIARLEERLTALKEAQKSDHQRLNELESRFDRKVG